MSEDLKPQATLHTDIEIGIDVQITGSVTTTRNGVLVELDQSYSTPKGNIKIGDTLIHKVSYVVFTVVDITDAGFVLKDIKDGIKTTADIRTIKQSCWILAESASPQRSG